MVKVSQLKSWVWLGKNCGYGKKKKERKEKKEATTVFWSVT